LPIADWRLLIAKKQSALSKRVALVGSSLAGC